LHLSEKSVIIFYTTTLQKAVDEGSKRVLRYKGR